MQRRASGLPGVSLVWGPWQSTEGGMTGEMSGAGAARIGRAGFVPLSADDGLALFDAAVASGQAVVVPARLDLASLRVSDDVPPLLRGLIRTPQVTRPTAGSAAAASLLHDVPLAQRGEALLDLVRTHVAVALGHGSASSVDPDRAFSELGFDSLTAVELRNRLSAATGLRLPATLVFDYPSARALAGYINARVVRRGAGATRLRRCHRQL